MTLISYGKRRNDDWYEKLSLEERNQLKADLKLKRELTKKLETVSTKTLAERCGVSKPTIQKFDRQLRRSQ